MTKLGQDLIKAAEEALAIARGELDPKTYCVHTYTPNKETVAALDELSAGGGRVRRGTSKQIVSAILGRGRRS